MVTFKKSVCIVLTCLLALTSASCSQQGGGSSDSIPATESTAASTSTEVGDLTEPYETKTELETETEPETVACAHEYGEWIVDKEAGPGVEGSRYAVCGLCGATVQESIEALQYSKGLRYEANDDGTCYVSGIGDCTDEIVVIPSAHGGKAVTGIGVAAFINAEITAVYIPKGVTYIKDYAFMCCNRLTSVTIPEGVTYIGNLAFDSCIELVSITIPEGVTYIGQNVFSRCTKLTSVTLPVSGSDMFSDCTALTSVTFLDGVSEIGAFMFKNCTSLTSVTIPDSVTVIRHSAFRNCTALSDIYYAGSVKEWNTMPKDTDWKRDTKLFVVHYNYTPET